jgi:pantothenate kinase
MEEEMGKEGIKTFKQCIPPRDDITLLLERLQAHDNISHAEEHKLACWAMQNAGEFYGDAFGVTTSQIIDHVAELRNAFPKVARACRGLVDVTDLWSRHLPLAFHVLSLRDRSESWPFVLGINGIPGVGKTTLAAILYKTFGALIRRHAVASICIDDFYYPASERRTMGLERWGPGAHDLRLASRLRALRSSDASTAVEFPVFDKSVRDRSDKPKLIDRRVGLLVFEGFGVGYRGQGYHALSDCIDYLISLRTRVDWAKEWRRESGWADEHVRYRGDYARFCVDFENMWEVVAEQVSQVMPVIEAAADLVLDVGEGHRITTFRSQTPLQLDQ